MMMMNLIELLADCYFILFILFFIVIVYCSLQQLLYICMYVCDTAARRHKNIVCLFQGGTPKCRMNLSILLSNTAILYTYIHIHTCKDVFSCDT